MSNRTEKRWYSDSDSMDMYSQGNYNKPLGTLVMIPHTYENQTKRGYRNVGHGGLGASWHTSSWFLWHWSGLTGASSLSPNSPPVWTNKDQFLHESAVCNAVDRRNKALVMPSFNRKNRDQVDKYPDWLRSQSKPARGGLIWTSTWLHCLGCRYCYKYHYDVFILWQWYTV